MSATSRDGSLVRVGMAPRAAGMTMAQAQEHWRTTHGDVAPNGRFNYRFEEPR